MSSYTAEIDSAYLGIASAGSEITVINPVSTGFDPVTETETYQTAVLESGISESDTLILFQNPTETFPDSGIIQIDDEKMAYIMVGEALVCERGYNSTIPESHEADAVISLIATTWLTYALNKGYKESLIDGSAIQVGDKQMIIPAKDFPFQISQTCKILQNGTLWSVVNIEAVSPGSDAILYKIQVRQ